MIGGCDVILPTRSGPVALDCAVRSVLTLWPGAVFENAETNDAPRTYDRLEFGTVRQVLAYRDASIASEWARRGAALDLANTMIYLLSSKTDLTVVVSSPEAPDVAAYLVALREELLATEVLPERRAA
jgi:hypothetical protein